jgi:O-antigen/teichoic acid export membrane protein
MMGWGGISAFALLQGILIARSISPGQYGVWGGILASVEVARAFLGFRTSEPLTRYLVEFRSRGESGKLGSLLNSALTTDFLAGLAAFLVYMASVPLLARHVAGGDAMRPAYWIYGVFLLFCFVDSTWFSVAREQRKFKLMGRLQVAFALLRFLIVLAAWGLGALTLVNLSIIYVATAAAQAAVNLVILHRIVTRIYGLPGFRFVPVWSARVRADLSGFWDFMRNTYFSSMASSLTKQADILILGFFRADAEVGYYKLAKGLSAMIQSVTQFMAASVYQDFNELLTERKLSSLLAYVRRIVKYLAGPVLVVTVVSALAAKPLIPLVYGQGYEGAYWPFVAMLAGVGLSMIFFWAPSLVLALDASRAYLKFMLVHAIVSMGALFWGAKAFGAVGVAALFSSVMMAGYLGMFLIARSKIAKS